MMIVLEKVNATETYAALTALMPNARQIPKPMPAVKKIWPSPVARATGPVVRIRLRSSLSPTMNRSSEIPIWASSAIWSWLRITPNTAGPARIPVARNMMIRGCLSFWPTAPSTAAKPRIAAVS